MFKKIIPQYPARLANDAIQKRLHSPFRIFYKPRPMYKTLLICMLALTAGDSGITRHLRRLIAILHELLHFMHELLYPLSRLLNDPSAIPLGPPAPEKVVHTRSKLFELIDIELARGVAQLGRELIETFRRADERRIDGGWGSLRRRDGGYSHRCRVLRRGRYGCRA